MRKLIAVSVVGDWVGDWHKVRGDEHGFLVHPVTDNEEIELEVISARGRRTVPLFSGLNIMDVSEWASFRVVKRCSAPEERSSTSIELVIKSA